ncbi:MAG TPA: YchJ family metal-binding protein, partial [Rhodanobacteraceae bacterium]
LHDGQPAPDAERLMRSRYSAYVLSLEKYLLATWHASTRPDRLGLADESPAPTWLGLKVHAFTRDDTDHARVEFTARFRIGGQRAQRLHEQSRFVRENGTWFYLDGTVD